jgi:serine protease Do
VNWDQQRIRKWAAMGLLVAFPTGLFLGVLLAWGGSGERGEESGLAGPAPTAEALDRGAAFASLAADARDSGPVGRRGSTTATASHLAGVAGEQAAPGAPASPEREAQQNSRRYTPIVQAANRVIPSVVSVTVLKTVRQAGFRSLFEEFFGQVPRQFERTVRGLGSGFAIGAEGYIVTNEHVVAGADSMVVTDAEGRVYEATLVGSDELTDLAVLKIEAGKIPAAPLGTSSDIMVGEPAIAIGNPFGYLLNNAEATVTSGVISGVGRDIRAEQGETLLADMVQTDASINPGNSGGPLVNADGQVIGVNSSIFSRSGGSEGLGFAIPIDRARRIADELSEFGRIRRPYVGVDAVGVQSDTSLFSETRVRRVAPDSPADRAGLREGDVLVAVSGRAINSPLDWEVGLLDAGVRSEVEVTFSRSGRVRRTRVEIEELPSEQAERLEVVQGLELITLTPQIAVERGLGVDSGAMVVDISAQNARVTGMRVGDVVLQINRRQVETAEDANDLFQYYAGRSRIRVVLYRDGRTYYTNFYVQ